MGVFDSTNVSMKFRNSPKNIGKGYKDDNLFVIAYPGVYNDQY